MTDRGSVTRLSILTLVRDRNRMLADLLGALRSQTERDFDVVVCQAGGSEHAGEVVAAFGDLDIALVGLGDEGDRIPYSAARNTAARHSRGRVLCFLDADTIPAPTVVERIVDLLHHHDAVATGEVKYLPPVHRCMTTMRYGDLEPLARPHPAREAVPLKGAVLDADPLRLWGLYLAIRRSTFDVIGGFDENYGGYAGEDTDFVWNAYTRGVPSALVSGAPLLHQHHDSFEPPVHQLVATIANAQRFRDKWGWWPIRGWLDQFESSGFVGVGVDRIELVREPSAYEIEAARCGVAEPFRRPA